MKIKSPWIVLECPYCDNTLEAVVEWNFMSKPPIDIEEEVDTRPWNPHEDRYIEEGDHLQAVCPGCSRKGLSIEPFLGRGEPVVISEERGNVEESKIDA